MSDHPKRDFIQVPNPFADGFEDRGSTKQHYPDVVSAGSLAAALDDALERQGSMLKTQGSFYGKTSASFASVLSQNRSAQIRIAMLERLFLFDLWENEIELARGRTPDLMATADAIRRWLEERPNASELVQDVTFVQMTDAGGSYERGTYIEDTWQSALADPFKRTGNEVFHWDELKELIRLASERPELRRLLPYTSLWRFSVTTRSRPPDNTIPVIWPLGGGRFHLTQYWGGEVLAEGDAAHVLDALVAFLRDMSEPPRDIGPHGT